MQPIPFGEAITGTERRSASTTSSAPASERVTPWPMKIAGRSAASSIEATAATSSGAAPERRAMQAWLDAATSTSASSTKRLNGISTCTGPGRPPSMQSIASRSEVGSISTRVGWKLRFTTGRQTEGKSASCCRYSSWNGPRLNCCVGTFAVSARKAEELA